MNTPRLCLLPPSLDWLHHPTLPELACGRCRHPTRGRLRNGCTSELAPYCEPCAATAGVLSGRQLAEGLWRALD